MALVALGLMASCPVASQLPDGQLVKMELDHVPLTVVTGIPKQDAGEQVSDMLLVTRAASRKCLGVGEIEVI